MSEPTHNLAGILVHPANASGGSRRGPPSCASRWSSSRAISANSSGNSGNPDHAKDPRRTTFPSAAIARAALSTPVGGTDSPARVHVMTPTGPAEAR
jgi:hypothetical protein